MAHYAILDENNIVTDVFVGRDENDLIEGVTDWETYYNAKRTSYNTLGGQHTQGGVAFRKNYAGIGFTYDPVRDAFIPPQRYASWTLNEETCLWEAPKPYPTDGETYVWDESELDWVYA